MNKAYSRINFQNAPSTATPLNATNLNKMDKAINDLDDRIIELSGYQEEAEESAEMASASASAAAKAAETATADAEARVNEVIQGLEVYTKADSHKKFASVIKQVATGSPILIKDGTDAGALDFKGKGRSTQNGTPTPDSPIAIKSVADGGYFDGELLQGYYNESGGFLSNTSYVCSKNLIPCNSGDNVKLVYGGNIGSITFNFYDKDMNVLSRPSSTGNVTEYEATAPTNAKYVHFMFREVNGTITPQNAKHIAVTINGKYALIVKSKWKNLFNINDVPNWETYNTSFKRTYLTLKPNTEYICATNITEYGQIYFGTTTSFIGNQSYTTDATGKTLVIVKADVISNYNVMICEKALYDGTYEPYIESVKYIPLSEPIRSSLDGTVTDEVSLTEVTRRFKEVVLDGSDDEVISTYGNDYPHLFIISVKGVKKTIINIICTHFISYRKANNDYSKNMIYTIDNYILINHIDITSVDEFKAWLQANPITVIYELAEPIIEKIVPVDIVTYDNVTYLTASDNAEMEVTYATDTKSYIDSKFAELHAAIVNML